jgi:phage I-like protein
MSDAFVEIAAPAVELPNVGGPPRRVKLLPLGTIQMRDDRGPYMIRDLAHALRVVHATRNWLGSADMMFDYDHQSLFAVGQNKGGRAVAAGWAKAISITAEADGIYAEAEWTPAASQKLAAREYRYLSPTFLAEKGTGDVMLIKNVALTNMPAIDLPAVAASVLTARRGQPGHLLTADEIAACTMIGMSHADFLAAKAGEAEAVAAVALLTADEIAVCALTGMSHQGFIAAKRREGR